MSNKNTTQETYLKRTTFKITSKCTLKCKLCLAYIPYYKNPKDLSYENAKKILARFFSLVDKIIFSAFTLFSISSGLSLNKAQVFATGEYTEHLKPYFFINKDQDLLVKKEQWKGNK